MWPQSSWICCMLSVPDVRNVLTWLSPKPFFLFFIVLVDTLCQGRVGIRVKVTFYHLNIIYHLANMIFLPELNRKFYIYIGNNALLNMKFWEVDCVPFCEWLCFIYTESWAQVLNRMCHLKLKWKLHVYFILPLYLICHLFWLHV